MANVPNSLANIISAVGHVSGDAFVKDYDASFANWDDINPATWEADVASGVIDGFGFQNVGFITTDGAPEMETPDTEDNTTTTDLWDGVTYKTGRTVVTGRHVKFTLAETARDAATEFVNGTGSILPPTADYRDILQTGSNQTPQTVIIPCYLSNGKLALVIIENCSVVIDDVIKFTPNDPIVYAIDINPLTGANLPSPIITRESLLPVSAEPAKAPAPAPVKKPTD